MTRSSTGSTKTALVVGGTGPTGPDVVGGLVTRGYDTAIFHSGRHEIDLPGEVEHIHGDAHFTETIEEALGDREFDVVVAQYGRLQLLSEHFRGRTAHMVAIGGAMGAVAAPEDPRWGPMGRPALVREERRFLKENPEPDRLGFKIAEAARSFLAVGAEGGYRATYVAYPILYGPRQPGCPEWAIVRRLLDGRSRIILPDGGRRIESRAYIGNVAAAPLLALDNPEVAAGNTYLVTDREAYTVRQRVEFMAQHLGVDVELVDLPYDLATPAHPLYRHGPEHRMTTSDRIRTDLGYTEVHSTDEALAQTVDWLKASDAETIAEIEQQLSDPFDYAAEDDVLSWWDQALASAPEGPGGFTYSHMYRHPKQPGQNWAPAKDKA